MIILLSPATSLDFESAAAVKTSTQPTFTKQSSQLMKTLREHSAQDLGKLMKLSESLSDLNAKRNKAWKAKHDADNSKAAVFAFQGDVYKGMDVDTMSAAEVKRCQKHVRILSGLYGILRPLDLIQPYRLEMGTKLKTPNAKNLYEFWDTTVRDAIQADLKKLKSDLIVNLASNEYSKVAKLKTCDGSQIITPAFRDFKNGQYKMISFFAKRARGMMTRHLICNSVTSVKGITTFKADGYKYNKELSTPTEPVFTRKAS